MREELGLDGIGFSRTMQMVTLLEGLPGALEPTPKPLSLFEKIYEISISITLLNLDPLQTMEYITFVCT